MLAVPGWQTLLAQQPVGQVVGLQVGGEGLLQTPAEQVVPPPHGAHAPPLEPQAWRDVPTRQTEPAQQPGQFCFVHLVLLEAVQRPEMQARPSSQLKFSTQVEPAGLEPPSQRPLMQRPAQQ